MIKRFFKSKMAYDYFHDPSALIGSFILAMFIFAAVSAPWIAPQNPYDLEMVNLADQLKPPMWMEGGESPFLLGTDDQGRDILSTMLYGCRTSLVVAFGVVAIAGTFGTVLGLIAGYYGGLLSAVIMRTADTLFSFSTVLIAFLLLGLLKTRGVLVVIIAVCIADWVRYARTMRGSVMETKEEAYILAAKATGAGTMRILFKHLLPNAIPPLFVVVAVDMAVVIMLEATLSFLGVGVPITEPSLGMMIAIGKDYVYSGMWWIVAFPGTALVLLVIGINLFADWLREEFNPKIEKVW